MCVLFFKLFFYSIFMVDKFLAFFITVHIVAFTCFCVFLPCILQSLRNELHIEFRKFHLIQGILAVCRVKYPPVHGGTGHSKIK